MYTCIYVIALFFGAVFLSDSLFTPESDMRYTQIEKKRWFLLGILFLGLAYLSSLNIN